MPLEKFIFTFSDIPKTPTGKGVASDAQSLAMLRRQMRGLILKLFSADAFMHPLPASGNFTKLWSPKRKLTCICSDDLSFSFVMELREEVEPLPGGHVSFASPITKRSPYRVSEKCFCSKRETCFQRRLQHCWRYRRNLPHTDHEDRYLDGSYIFLLAFPIKITNLCFTSGFTSCTRVRTETQIFSAIRQLGKGERRTRNFWISLDIGCQTWT